MLFKKIENNVPVGNLITEGDMLRIAPEVTNFETESLAAAGYGVFVLTESGISEDVLKEYTEGAPVLNSENEWEQQWSLTDIEFSSDAELDAYIENKTREATNTMRECRNYLLRLTDFYALSDAPTMSAEMSTYRQALRDLPDNVTDVFNVDYPVNPEDPEGLLA
ncbi:MAG: hypothetical protein HOM18_05135 [Candidatus Marinimicrobia bacterium]|jgi:hypothetical protein|nr:hypothetical protein [Candidatus Neomarinimicrobiota bacterium]